MAVLAHYGGVPEALTIALPVAIFTAFLLAERAARRRERGREQDAELDERPTHQADPDPHHGESRR